MDNAFSFYTTVFGLIVGMMSIFGVIFAFCQSHLPNPMIKELFALLEETQCLYESAVEAGLLPDSTLRSQMRDTLVKLWNNAQNLRFRAHSATTLLEDYQGFFNGLSYSIAVACSQVKELRASIIRLTRREAERCGAGICTDYSPVRQSSSSTLPQICCAERFVPSPQFDFPVHLHARRTATLLRLMYDFAYMTSRPS
ncbi:hypothetical protein K503DRAFT_719206 [Rhizopogon vinicolor AM-OR11-026]|uniref:Uncharacterized protein n=1 Tax=Rhizopogon vinicolor AM-OR11-026 TaxID=1314800 RepID=A0A1B7MYZ4_9AGAM|nr:hypothetical protein K503DRAFT_719206 [Rhizopogon vinicolor AM-OR11-026]